MLGRIIIIAVGAGFASYLVVTAVLTILGINPATLHLSKFFRIGYSAINAVLIPFGISGVIGAASRKKTLVRAFVTFQWWLATFILIGLNIFNIFLSKRGRGDFINKCQASLASDPNSLNQCAARANYAENVTFIATCVEGGIMLFLGIVLLIVGTREYNNISLEEETKNLLEKANFKENDEVDEMRNLSPKRSNFNDPSDSGNDRTTSVKRQPSKPTTVNVDLERQNNTNVNRNITNPIIQPDLNITTPLYRKPTLPTIPGNIPPKRETRYPINTNNGPVNRANVTRQPTIPIVNDGPVNRANVTRQPTIPIVNDGPVNRANVTRQPTIPIVNDGPVNRTNITRQPTIPIVNDGPVNRANVTRQPIIPIVNDGPVSRANVTRQPTIPIANDGPINRTNITRQPTIPIVNDGPANRANVTRQPTIPIVNDGPANRANVTRQPTIGNAYAPRNYVGKPQATYPPPQRPLTKQYMNPPQRSISTKQYMNPQQSSQQYKNPPQRSLSTKYINPPLPPPQMKLPPPPLPEANEYGGEYNNYRPKPAMPPYYMGRD